MTDTQPHPAYELVYCEQDRDDYLELQRKLKERWPAAVFTDACDDIHGYRFQVDIAGVTQDELFTFMVQNEFALQGLGFQLAMHSDTARMRELVTKAKAAGECINCRDLEHQFCNTPTCTCCHGRRL